MAKHGVHDVYIGAGKLLWRNTAFTMSTLVPGNCYGETRRSRCLHWCREIAMAKHGVHERRAITLICVVEKVSETYVWQF